jgi:hypothetical protein
VTASSASRLALLLAPAHGAFGHPDGVKVVGARPTRPRGSWAVSAPLPWAGLKCMHCRSPTAARQNSCESDFACTKACIVRGRSPPSSARRDAPRRPDSAANGTSIPRRGADRIPQGPEFWSDDGISQAAGSRSDGASTKTQSEGDMAPRSDGASYTQRPIHIWRSEGSSGGPRRRSDASTPLAMAPGRLCKPRTQTKGDWKSAPTEGVRSGRETARSEPTPRPARGPGFGHGWPFRAIGPKCA